MRTVFSPSLSPPKLTIEGPSPYSSPTLPLPLRPLRPTLMPSLPSSTSLSQWETLPGCPFASPPTKPNSPSTLSPSLSSRRIRASSSRASRSRSLTPRTSVSSPPDSSIQTPAQGRAKPPPRSLSPSTLGTSRQWVPPSDFSLARAPSSGPTPQTGTPSARTAGATATSLPDARPPTRFAPSVPSTTHVPLTAVPTPPALEVATLRLLLAVALPLISRCVNCGENHTAVHRDCESRPVPPTLRRSSAAAEEVPPPPIGDEMDTAADVQDHSPPPSPTRSLQSAFEMATPRARRTTILPASVRPTQSTGALPPAEQPSPSPMSRTASGLAR